MRFSTRRKKVESLGINVMNTTDKLKPIILVASSALGFSQKLVDYFKNRWIVFLHDIPKRVAGIVSVNNEIEQTFKQKLSNTDLKELHNLNEAYQKSIVQTR